MRPSGAWFTAGRLRELPRRASGAAVEPVRLTKQPTTGCCAVRPGRVPACREVRKEGDQRRKHRQVPEDVRGIRSALGMIGR